MYFIKNLGSALCLTAIMAWVPVAAGEVDQTNGNNLEQFQLDVTKTIKALEQVQAIYGQSDKKSLSAAQQKAIDDLLQSTQKNMKSVIDAKVIYGYGDDDRKNLYEATAQEKKAAKSVALVLDKSDLLANGSTESYNLPGATLGLCSSERFHKEPAPGFCSAFRVGTDLIATAGHCIKTPIKCSKTSFVFGFNMNAADEKPHKSVKKSKVYNCKSIIDGELNGPDNSDWRIIKVDREITDDVPIVEVRKQGRIDVGDAVTVVGHPMGLPLKVTPGGVVRSLNASFFVANPDTYGGNSGSPAFNSEALSAGKLFVEGILVRGEEDFSQFSPCLKSKRCAEDGCRGEDITYASEFLAAIGSGQ